MIGLILLILIGIIFNRKAHDKRRNQVLWIIGGILVYIVFSALGRILGRLLTWQDDFGTEEISSRVINGFFLPIFLGFVGVLVLWMVLHRLPKKLPIRPESLDSPEFYNNREPS